MSQRTDRPVRRTVRTQLGFLAALAGVGVVIVLVWGLAPITGHHGDGEQACGSLWRHRTVTDAFPATVATSEQPARPGSAGTQLAAACPPEDFARRERALATWLPIGGLSAAAFYVVAVRRRPRGDLLEQPARPAQVRG